MGVGEVAQKGAWVRTACGGGARRPRRPLSRCGRLDSRTCVQHRSLLIRVGGEGPDRRAQPGSASGRWVEAEG
jgi:hypothetical protein